MDSLQIFRKRKIHTRYAPCFRKRGAWHVMQCLTHVDYVLAQVAEETAHLAPHGVPSNPIPRALSSTRLNDLQNQNGFNDSYGTYQPGGNALEVPGGVRNPFQK